MTSTKKADSHVQAALPTGVTSELDRNQALTHRHASTIGWITLGILATVPWLSLGGSTFHRGEAVGFRSLSGTISDEVTAAGRAG
jgi:hypothetical protein